VFEDGSEIIAKDYRVNDLEPKYNITLNSK